MNGMQQPSGDQFLMVFCPEGGQADDWLVSPEVKGGSGSEVLHDFPCHPI